MKIKLKNIEKEFSRIKEEYRKNIKENSNNIVNDLVLDLVNATPIDTGKARASWSKQNKLHSYVIGNSTDYIQYLNAGTSKQAPAFFIERTALHYGKPKGTIVDVKQD